MKVRVGHIPVRGSMERLVGIYGKSTKTIVGVMSGMSMDGVNLVCARISGVFPSLRVETVGSRVVPYSAAFRQRLLAARHCNLQEVAELNRAIAATFAEQVLTFIESLGLSPSEVDAIGSHGQTLFHGTASSSMPAGPTPVTLQVGDPSLIAEQTGIVTIGNFRQRDIAAGGHGAPLVAFADYVLYRRLGETVAMNNLGSVSNVTVVPESFAGVIAFDTGPANMAIDTFAALVPGNLDGFDRDGAVSAQGVVVEPFLTDLLKIPFLATPPPKAAGYAEFGPHALAEIARPYVHHRQVDLLRTAVEFTARSIAQAYGTFVTPRYPSLTHVTFSGGGIYNRTLMERVTALMPHMKVGTLSPTEADAKEALAFAILAHETLCGRPSNVPSATGAHHQVVLGEIAV